jgi:hypothetical protein
VAGHEDRPSLLADEAGLSRANMVRYGASPGPLSRAERPAVGCPVRSVAAGPLRCANVWLQQSRFNARWSESETPVLLRRPWTYGDSGRATAIRYASPVGSVEQRSRHRCSGPDLSADVTFDAQPDAAIKQAKAEGNLSRVRRPRVQDLPDGLAPHAMECWHVPTRAGSGLGGHSSGVGRGAARP